MELVIACLALAVGIINLVYLLKLRRNVAQLPFADLATKHELASGLTSHFSQNFQQFQFLERLTHDLALDFPLPPVRGWAASPDFLLTAYQTARRIEPGLIVECGSGVSTLIMARAVQQNGKGRVLTLDHDAVFAAKTRELLEEHGLQEFAEVVHAPLAAQKVGNEDFAWYRYDVPPDLSIDLLIVDGPPEGPNTLARYPAGPRFIPQLNEGGTVLVDDAQRPNEQTAVHRWLEELPNLQAEYVPLEKGCSIVVKGRPSQ